MKKVLLFAACAVFSLAASAQRASSSTTSFFSTEKAEQPVTIGVRAGLNFANLAGDADTDSRTGFHVGVDVDVPILESFYFKTGLYYTQKGCKLDESDEYGKYEMKANPSYLEIPVLASYRYNFSDVAQLQFNVGPYLAYGIGGKMKITNTAEEESGDYDYFGDEGGAKRFDIGYQVGFGFTYSKAHIGIAYERSFSKINSGEGKLYNSNFLISLGYNF